MADMFDKLLNTAFFGVDIGAREGPWQKGVAPIFGAFNRISTGAHGDKPRQILILCAEAICHPGAGRRTHEPRIAAVHQHQRRLVIGHIGVHRPHHQQPVGMPCHRGKQRAYLQPTLAMPGKSKRGGEGSTGAPLRRQGAWHILPGIFFQRHFPIKRVEMARAAVGKQMDHSSGPRGKVRRPRFKCPRHQPRGCAGGRLRAGCLGVGPEQRGGPQPAHPHAGAGQRLAAGEPSCVVREKFWHASNPAVVVGARADEVSQ